MPIKPPPAPEPDTVTVVQKNGTTITEHTWQAVTVAAAPAPKQPTIRGTR
jgi:hypothetical protein